MKNGLPQHQFSCLFRVLLSILVFTSLDVRNVQGLCTEDGLLRSTEYWATVIRQKVYDDLSNLVTTAKHIQERVSRRTFCPTVSLANERFLKNGGTFYFSDKSKASYIVLKEKNIVPSEAINYTLNDDPNLSIQKLYPYKSVWTPAPADISGYCAKFHSLDCSSEVSSDQSSCPLYCREPALFNNSMLGFDLTALSSIEEDLSTRFRRYFNDSGFISITTKRNLTMVIPEVLFYRYLDLLDFQTSSWSAFNLSLLRAGPLINKNRDLIWVPPNVQTDVKDPTKLVVVISIHAPIYLGDAYIGFAALVFKLSISNQYLDGVKPSPSGFCLVADATSNLIFSPQAAKTFFNVSDRQIDYSLLTAKNGSLREIMQEAQAFALEHRISDIDDALIAQPVSSYRQVQIDQMDYLITYSPLQLAPLTLFCFVPKRELLDQGSMVTSASILSMNITQGDMIVKDIFISNTGLVDLVHDIFISPPPESNWLILKDLQVNATFSSQGNDTLDYEQPSSRLQIITRINETRKLQIEIISKMMNADKLTSVGIIIDTKDTKEGWCYVNRTEVKLNVQVQYDINQLVYVSYGSAAGVIFTFLTCLLVLMCLVLAIYTLINKNDVWIKTANPVFCLFISLSCAITTSSVFFWIGEADEAKCNGRVWFALVGFSLMISTFIVKFWRVMSIVKSAHASRYSRKDLTPQKPSVIVEHTFYLVIFGIVMFEIILLILWTSIDTLTTEVVTGVSYLSPNQKSMKCTGNHLSAWMGLMIAYNGLLMLIGCLMSHRSRVINDILNDSKMTGVCIYNTFLVSSIIIPLLIFLSLSPENQLILIALAIYAVNLMVIGLLLIPRIWKVFRNEKMDRSSSRSTSTSGSGAQSLSRVS